MSAEYRRFVVYPARSRKGPYPSSTSRHISYAFNAGYFSVRYSENRALTRIHSWQLETAPRASVYRQYRLIASRSHGCLIRVNVR